MHLALCLGCTVWVTARSLGLCLCQGQVLVLLLLKTRNKGCASRHPRWQPRPQAEDRPWAGTGRLSWQPCGQLAAEGLETAGCTWTSGRAGCSGEECGREVGPAAGRVPSSPRMEPRFPEASGLAEGPRGWHSLGGRSQRLRTSDGRAGHSVLSKHHSGWGQTRGTGTLSDREVWKGHGCELLVWSSPQGDAVLPGSC